MKKSEATTINPAPQNLIKGELEKTFLRKFGTTATLFRSPGRINLLGEHTDYNEGYVLPAAINKFVYVAISTRSDNQVVLYATDYDQTFQCDLEQLIVSPLQWPNYVLGVTSLLLKQQAPLTGFNMCIDGDIPIGAGLSSSAAISCAAIFALNETFQLGFNRFSLAKMAQQAEHEFAGVKCGIMDPFASLFGKQHHAIQLDCRNLHYEYIPLLLPGYSLVLLNTNVKHNLASTAYNKRREEGEEAVALLKEKYPELHSLRDASLAMLQDMLFQNHNLLYRRCKYVVEENQRVLDACHALQHADAKKLGELMFQTHEGLSKEYEVSCMELDFLVTQAINHPDIIGARMMGGGFGGCTINLVKEEKVNDVIASIEHAYQKTTGKALTAYVVETADGSTACLD